MEGRPQSYGRAWTVASSGAVDQPPVSSLALSCPRAFAPAIPSAWLTLPQTLSFQSQLQGLHLGGALLTTQPRSPAVPGCHCPPSPGGCHSPHPPEIILFISTFHIHIPHSTFTASWCLPLPSGATPLRGPFWKFRGLFFPLPLMITTGYASIWGAGTKALGVWPCSGQPLALTTS